MSFILKYREKNAKEVLIGSDKPIALGTERTTRYTDEEQRFIKYSIWGEPSFYPGEIFELLKTAKRKVKVLTPRIVEELLQKETRLIKKEWYGREDFPTGKHEKVKEK